MNSTIKLGVMNIHYGLNGKHGYLSVMENLTGKDYYVRFHKSHTRVGIEVDNRQWNDDPLLKMSTHLF